MFSECRMFRYILWRRWDYRPLVNFIGLNPSTADETEDDPTIRRCIGFAKERWKAGGILMTNIFAFRATDPKKMKEAIDPVGPDNDLHLRWIAGCSAKKIACWGVHGAFQYRGSTVARMIGRQFLWCFGRTKAGHPKHPLYLQKAIKLVRMRKES